MSVSISIFNILVTLGWNLASERVDGSISVPRTLVAGTFTGFCSDAQTEQIYTQPAEDARRHAVFNAARSAHVPHNYPSASPMIPMRLGHSSSKATASPAKLLAPADDPFRAAVSVDTGFSARRDVHVAHGEHGAASGAF